MVPRRPTITVAVGSFAAALALAGCGGDGYGLGNSETAKLGSSVSEAGTGPTTAPSAPAESEDDSSEETGSASEDAAGDSVSPVDAGSGEADVDEEGARVEPLGLVTDILRAKKVPRMGGVVTDATGWVLYRFDKDSTSPSESNCSGDCAKVWPPVLADQTLELSGIGTAKVSTIERADGGRQVTIGGWPVYRYIGDTEPGSWKGQNVAATWFAVQKDGSKNLTCLPRPAPKAVKPPADEASTGSAGY